MYVEVNEVCLTAHLPLGLSPENMQNSRIQRHKTILDLQRGNFLHSSLDGLLFKIHKFTVPHALRSQMLEKIHESRTSGNNVKCKQWPHDVLFWPGMSTQIEEQVAKCTCSTLQPISQANTKEPMIIQETPGRP